MFRYQHRLERGVTISKQLHTHRAGVTVSDPDPEDTPLLSHDAPALLPLGDAIVIWSADDGALTTTRRASLLGRRYDAAGAGRCRRRRR